MGEYPDFRELENTAKGREEAARVQTTPPKSLERKTESSHVGRGNLPNQDASTM